MSYRQSRTVTLLTVDDLRGRVWLRLDRKVANCGDAWAQVLGDDWNHRVALWALVARQLYGDAQRAVANRGPDTCLTDLVLSCLSGSPGPIPELFHSTKTSGTKVGRPLWLWCGWRFRGFGPGRPPAVLNALAGPQNWPWIGLFATLVPPQRLQTERIYPNKKAPPGTWRGLEFYEPNCLKSGRRAQPTIA